MSDTKITGLATLTSLADADLLAVVDDVVGTPVSRSLRADQIKTYIEAGGQIAPYYAETADETSAGVTVVDYSELPKRVLRYGTNTSPGVTDMSTAVQAAIDVAEIRGGEVVFPNQSVKVTTAQIVNANNITLRGEGPSSLLTNTSTGNCLEIGDNVTQRTDIHVVSLGVQASAASSSCILVQKCPNTRIDRCWIKNTGTSGRGITLTASWSSTITHCTFGSIQGYGIHISNTTYAMEIAGNRMDGNTGFGAIGVYISGGNGSSINGNTIESFYGCGVLCDGAEGLEIEGNYFEANGQTGITFTSGESRTIKADIVLNGQVFPVLAAAFPCSGVTISGNSFAPPAAADIDCSIYLIGAHGVTESSNHVNTAYNSPAAFIKTKNNSSLYQFRDLELGNSRVQGVIDGTDVYFDIEDLNNASNTAYDETTLKTIHIPARQAPRFNAPEDAAYDPTTPTVHINNSNALTVTLQTPKYIGRKLYNVARAGAGTSDVDGGTVLEADYDGFWDGELWLYYLEVKSITNTPGFEIWINDGTTWFASGGGSATTTSFVPRTIVFKPATGSNVLFAYRMTGGTGADVVRMTRPILCPLGSLYDFHNII